MARTWGAQIRLAAREKKRKERDRKRRERAKTNAALRTARHVRDWYS